MNTPSIRMRGDRILVRPIEVTQTPGGIYLPDSAQQRATTGTVLAIGPGVDRDKRKLANLIDFDVSVGNQVIYTKYGGTEVEIEGESLVILRDEDIYAVLPS